MASTRRRSPSGKRSPPFPTCRQDPSSHRQVLSAEEGHRRSFRRHTLLPLNDCTLCSRPVASDALVPSPVSATQRDLRFRRSKAKPRPNANSRPMPNRLFSYRPRRGSNCARQALPHRRHRPNVEVRLRQVARESGAGRGGLTSPPDRRQSPTRSTPSSPTTGPTPPRQAIRVRRPRTSRPPWTLGSLLGARLRCASAQNAMDDTLTNPNTMDQRQVERMNRTIKDAAVERYFYQNHDRLRVLRRFRRRLQLRQTPGEWQRPHPIQFVCKAWTSSLTIQTQSAPANAGTKHLGGARATMTIGRRQHATATGLRNLACRRGASPRLA